MKKKRVKLAIPDIRIMLPKVITVLEELMNWMESLRTSGDAGDWDWEKDDEYTKAQQVLKELRKLENKLKLN